MMLLNPLRNAVAELQARILARMLRAGALVALVALLLSPPVVAAYSIWAVAVALFWLVGAVLSCWLNDAGHAKAAAAVFVASTWLTFTVPGLFSAERFSEENIIASLVIAALLLSRPWVLAVGLGSVALAGAVAALDATAYALPVLLPQSNYLRLVSVMLEMTLVAAGLWLVAEELGSGTDAGAIGEPAPEHAQPARRHGEDRYRKLFTHSADASLVLDDGRFNISINIVCMARLKLQFPQLLKRSPR